MAEHSLEADIADDASNRRSLKSFFVKPRFYVPIARYFMAAGVTMIVLVVGAIFWRMQAIDAQLNSAQAMAAGGHIPVYDAFTDITTIALAGLCLFVVVACFLALTFAHRVAGPMGALVQHLEELKKGNYDYQRPLRKNDLLIPIHDAISDLGRALKEQRASQITAGSNHRDV